MSKNNTLKKYYEQLAFLPDLYGNNKNIKMQDIFVQLELSYFKTKKFSCNFTIDEILKDRSFNTSIILSNPGFGKTTLFRHSTLALLDDNRIAFYFEWKKIYSEVLLLSGFFDFLSDFLRKKIYITSEDSETEIRFILNNDCYIFIDGLDEVSKKDTINSARFFNESIKSNNCFHFLFSSRLANYSEEFANFFPYEYYKIEPLQEHQIIKYINRFIPAYEHDESRSQRKIDDLMKEYSRNQSLKNVLTQPLFLHYIILLIEENYLPNDRIRIYSKCIEMLITKWKRSNNYDNAFSKIGVTDKVFFEVIAEAAYLSFEEFLKGISDYGKFSKESLRNIITKIYNSRLHIPNADIDNEKNIGVIFDYLVKETGLIIEISFDIYSFSHLTLFEYLTAKHLTDKINKGFSENTEYIEKLIVSEKFETIIEVLMFIIEILDNTHSLERYIDIITNKLIKKFETEKNSNIIFLLGNLLKNNIEFSKDHIKDIILMLIAYTSNNYKNEQISGLFKEIMIFSESFRNQLAENFNTFSYENSLWESVALRMAHKFGNKLFWIAGDMELIQKEIKKEQLSIEKIQASTEDVFRQLETMELTLKEIKDYSGDISLSNEIIEVNRLFDGIFIRLKKEFKNILILVDNNISTIGKYFKTDMKRLYQIFEELIENSIKHSKLPEKDLRISITIDINHKDLKVFYSDNGTGILKKNSERIFEPFFSTDAKSSGIGMALIKKIIRRLNGDIEIDSEHKKGAMFILTFELEVKKKNEEN